MNFIRSFIFQIINYSTLAVFIIALYPINFIYPKKSIWVMEKVGEIFIFLSRVICGVDYKVYGSENLLKSGNYIIASKHQSIWETAAYLSIFKKPIFVIKKELFNIPFYGKFLEKSGMICVNRKDGRKALIKMIQDIKNIDKQGRPIIIFPEGTRTIPGESVSYQPGIYMIQQEVKRPIIPVAINSGVHWKKTTFSKNPGTISVKILPSIPVNLNRKECIKKLEEVIESESIKL